MTRARKRAACGGFTLIELVATIGMILLLLVVASLNASSLLAHYRLRGAVRQVATDLRLVRAKAVTQNETYRVRFTAGGSAYVVERFNPATDSWEPHALRSKTITSGASVPVPLEPPVSVVSNVDVEFEPRGNSTGARTVTLRDPGLPGATVPVTVTFAGQVRAD